MKLTKSQLRRVIKEELIKVIQEARELPPWLRKPQEEPGQRPALHIPLPPPEKPPSSPLKPKSTKVDYRLEEEDTQEEEGWQDAAEAFDDWRERNEDWVWKVMEEDLLAMFLGRRTKYRQYVVQFANAFGMYKGDILEAARKRSNALYVQLKGYLNEPPGYRRHHSWSRS